MSFPAQIGAHVAAALLIIGAVWLVWVVLRMVFRTRPSATGGGKSAGSSERPRPWRRDAKAEGLAGPEAADTVPDGGVALPPPPSGTNRGCVYCPQIDDEPHYLDCPRRVWADPIDEHIDTAAALLSPGSPVERDGEFADAVENWLRLVTPPVVPGGES